MSVITLTTDWGDDVYVGMAKGMLLGKAPDVTVVDLSHHVRPFQLVEAVYILSQGFPCFPEGTVHVLSVNTDAAPDVPFVALSYRGHYFIGRDNGFVGLLTGNSPERMVQIVKYDDRDLPSFAALSVLIPAAVDLCAGEPLESLGPVLTAHRPVQMLLPPIQGSVIQGGVLYIDHYRNLITNITRPDFVRAVRNRPFEIWVGSSRYRIRKISVRYSDVPEGELVALFNAAGYLEIAMNQGHLADMLSLDEQSSVLVKCLES